MDTRQENIEDRIRRERMPTLENLLRDVTRRPGYFTNYWYKAFWLKLTTGNGEALEWRKVINQAIRDGHIRRDSMGKLWPATGPFPKPFEYTRLFISEWAKPVMWFFVFAFCMYATMYGGKALIDHFGWIGHICRAAGMLLTLFAAGCFWRAVEYR